MNILMLTEYFYPYAHGGSEWSVYYLARAFNKYKQKVIVLTPNYGSSSKKEWKGVSVHRFPFLKHISKNNPKTLSPIWHNNIFWYIFSFIFVLFEVLKTKTTIIHVQGKSLIPAAIMTKWVLKKPVIVTLRDYYILCPYGLCLTKKREFVRCSLKYLLKEELDEYFSKYVTNKSKLSRIFHFFAAFNAWITAAILRFFLTFANDVICISNKQQLIYAENHIQNTQVIYNIMKFNPTTCDVNKDEYVLFIGRITPGKGADLFFDAILYLTKQKNKVCAKIIGEGFLRKTLEKKVKNQKISNISFLGQVSYEKTLGYLKKAKLVVVPSRWEEPFGRVALEALSYGVPVVASSQGGLPEIVVDGKSGYIVEPELLKLTKSIKKALRYNPVLRKNIIQSYNKLKNRFYTYPLQQHIKLYKKYE